MRLIADPGWAAAMLGPLLAHPDAGWPLACRVAGDRATLVIERRAGAALTVTMIGPGAAAATGVVASGRHMFVRVLGGSGRLDRWPAGEVDDRFTAASAPPLGRRCSSALRAGAVMEIDGRRDAHRIVAVGRELVLLTLTLAQGAAPLLREYALPGGRLRRVAAAEGEPARAAMLVELLGALDGGSEGLAAAARHPAFFVRWAAMRHWLARDAAGARPVLAAMAVGDPHPEVRDAAVAALAMPACPA
ncbi:hypothetical protein COC42_08100 [Sphingomonas spermidinifaciens]|uniref:HEAT repeat domain-containing protein n=1 Tax=Sphingomonas spermidinifaciens TaxID=1141889 RepID=A0A2A4B828_9SPHN|nr:hypothetical protein [Sphingomonas spermidinifaciens]PCD04237.1 hypothetical protein COC42_08100 [Sphingomonas spermidinifaciens]